MTFPGFPPGLPPLPADAQPLAERHRAYVDALPAHKRFEAEWTIRSIDAAFLRATQFRGSPTAPATGGNAGGFNVTRSASAHPYPTFAEDRQEPCDGSDASVAASVDPVGPSAAADLQDALRNESYREGLGSPASGMTEALKAAEIHWSNKRDAA